MTTNADTPERLSRLEQRLDRIESTLSRIELRTAEVEAVRDDLQEMRRTDIIEIRSKLAYLHGFLQSAPTGSQVLWIAPVGLFLGAATALAAVVFLQP